MPYNNARQMATSDVRFRHKKFPFRDEKSWGVPLDFLTQNSYVLNRGVNLFPSFLFFGQARSLFGVKIYLFNYEGGYLHEKTL